jgi:hypothetical protein
VKPSHHLALLALALLLPALAYAQTERNSVMYPAPAEPGELIGALGATVTILPRPIAEEEIRQIPMIDAGLRVGLSYGFSALASVSTNVLTTAASASAQWSYRFNNYSIAVGDRQSLWYGTAKIEGFDATAFGWMNHPYVSIGGDYKELRILLRAELTYVLSRTTRIGDEAVATDANVNAGSAFTLAIEQPFIGETDVSIGFRLHITDSAVQSWLAFSTFRDKLYYPELLFSVTL